VLVDDLKPKTTGRNTRQDLRRSRRFGSNRWLAEVDIDGYDRLRDRQRIITAHAIAARAACVEVWGLYVGCTPIDK